MLSAAVRSSQPISRSKEAVFGLDDMAHKSVTAALSAIRMLASDAEVQSFFDGLPTNFDIVITFAVNFLFKVSAGLSTTVQFNVQEFRQLVGDSVAVLKESDDDMHPRHVLVSLTKGIDGILQRCGSVRQTVPTVNAFRNLQDQLAPGPGILGAEFS